MISFSQTNENNLTNAGHSPSFHLKAIYTIGKTSMNASIIYRNQVMHVCTETNLYKS